MTTRSATPDVTDPAKEPARSVRPVPVALVGVLLGLLVEAVIVLLVAVMRQHPVPSYDGSGALSPLEKQAILAAQTDVLTLTNVTPATAQQQLKRVLAQGTVSFGYDTQQFPQTLINYLTQNKLTAKGTIADGGIGIVKTDPKNQTVIVLVPATLQLSGGSSSTSSSSPSAISYQLQVVIQRVNGKSLLASIGPLT